MKLKPAKTHILVKFYQPENFIIETPGSQFGATLADNRTRVEVKAIGPDVKTCKDGDFLLLIPKPTILPIDSENDLFLVDEGQVLGIVEDDTAPIELEA